MISNIKSSAAIISKKILFVTMLFEVWSGGVFLYAKGVLNCMHLFLHIRYFTWRVGTCLYTLGLYFFTLYISVTFSSDCISYSHICSCGLIISPCPNRMKLIGLWFNQHHNLDISLYKVSGYLTIPKGCTNGLLSFYFNHNI